MIDALVVLMVWLILALFAIGGVLVGFYIGGR